jgi:hypothetical protein
MRLEGYHKEFKKYATAITSRRNSAFSIVIKEMLKLSQRIFSEKIINWNEKLTSSKLNVIPICNLNIPFEAVLYS